MAVEFGILREVELIEFEFLMLCIICFIREYSWCIIMRLMIYAKFNTLNEKFVRPKRKCLHATRLQLNFEF